MRGAVQTSVFSRYFYALFLNFVLISFLFLMKFFSRLFFFTFFRSILLDYTPLFQGNEGNGSVTVEDAPGNRRLQVQVQNKEYNFPFKFFFFRYIFKMCFLAHSHSSVLRRLSTLKLNSHIFLCF